MNKSVYYALQLLSIMSDFFNKMGLFTDEPRFAVISERTTLRSLYAIADPSVCRLSSVCM